jgi:hypothetical protein
MPRWLVALFALGLVTSMTVPALAGDVFVNGHTRSDGTYVQPHMRSAPDSSYNNNWSTSPNMNPYTGQQGTQQPRLYDQSPSSSPGFGGFNGTGQGLGGTQQPRRPYTR